ncbi:MAG: hypothetical protein HOQ05_04690 [Corynebacteriales bacterium]|nr:hypothetical protein [Mycobacteriales bacterium]
MTGPSNVATHKALAEISEQRHIIGLLKACQDAHYAGEHATATAILTDLVTRFGRDTIDAALWVQAVEHVEAQNHLTRLFGRYIKQYHAMRHRSVKRR